MAGLRPKRRRRRAKPDATLLVENQRLKRENQRLTAKAETVLAARQAVLDEAYAAPRTLRSATTAAANSATGSLE